MTNDSAEPDEPIVIVVPREAVESCDTEQVLMGLSVLVRSAALAARARGKLQLAFDGFDGDPRELWQIPAVRRFVSRLDEVFPYWFFLADLRSETAFVLAACLCRTVEISPGQAKFNAEDLERLVLRQIDGVHQLCRLHALGDVDTAQVSNSILTYFANRQVFN